MKFIKIFIPSLLLLALTSCSQEYIQKDFYAMDTVMNISVSGKNASEALTKASEEIFKLDALFDRGNETSEIYKLNQDKSLKCSDEVYEIIANALDISEKTDGAFDITLAPLSDLWGFYSGNFYVPKDSEISTINTGYKNIALSTENEVILNDVTVDLGAIAKGYASDKAVTILKDYGINSAIISLGGNVYALGNKNGNMWKVAIQNPNDSQSTILTLSVSDKAVITSGIYQRNFIENGILHHHILDPETGKNPENNLASVTVIGESGIVCDALSTAFMVMGKERSVDFLNIHKDIDAVFITKENDIFVTQGIIDTIKTNMPFEIID